MGKWVKERLDKIMEVNPKSDCLPSKFIYIDLESVKQGRLLQQKIVGKDGAPSRAQRTLKPKDVLFQLVRPYQQNNYYFEPHDERDYVASTGYAVLRTDQDSKFCYFLLHRNEFQNRVEALCTGTGYPAITPKELSRIDICHPVSLDEQRHIAEILTTCDEVIEKSEAVVEKYRAIKAGMLKDLFTRGIGKNGKLRPPPESAPQLYRNTALGKVPREWEVKRVGELGDFKNGISKGGSAFGHGTPFVNLLDVFGKDILCDVQGLGLVETTPTEREQCSLRCGDVLFVRSSVKPTGVGLTTVVLKDLLNTVFSGFLLRYRANGLAPEFARYIFREDKFRARVIAVSTVSANTNVNQTSLKTLCIAFPQNMHEQQQIAKRLSAIDAKIADERAVIAKYRKVKAGLMARLLTPPDMEVE